MRAQVFHGQVHQFLQMVAPLQPCYMLVQHRLAPLVQLIHLPFHLVKRLTQAR